MYSHIQIPCQCRSVFWSVALPLTPLYAVPQRIRRMRFNICTSRSLGLGTRIRYGTSRALDGYTIEYQAEWSTVPVFRDHRCQDVLCALDLGLTGMRHGWRLSRPTSDWLFGAMICAGHSQAPDLLITVTERSFAFSLVLQSRCRKHSHAFLSLSRHQPRDTLILCVKWVPQ